MTPLAPAEITDELAELLPQRDTMLIDINVAPIVAVNLAIAVNAATIGSVANADAVQIIGAFQH
ncbi:hypothetical protein GCM10012320_17010 [Sinomonas cellulolyticus]|jgi:hypothetical protein|uniref:Uncharacterized protein n=1 Tax=Sinomonas cellulolyticus TaxID=2801916 RepID=A0ABS1JYY4_9MICC|nr:MULTISPECIES: hypothetical protein [Sinomonas]MBL0704525.1 hypothetical protein [Sinomonas cellulolyticus]GHG49183.1 hypothetical protein GCM10012320_17010 [Sinomonas sp. KCTC 49339]